MSSFQNIVKEVKENILKDYLSGIEVAEIAKKYSFKYARTVYHHLQPLSRGDKIMHAKNKLKRMEKENQ